MFFKRPNNKYVLLALLGATAGQGVVWYTGQFYALFFLTITLKVDLLLAYTMVGLSLLIGAPIFVLFGWMSDKIGRLKIILAGCLIAAVTYIPLFQMLAVSVNPALVAFQEENKVTLTTDTSECHFHIFVGPVVQVHQLRSGEGLPDQGGPVVRDGAQGWSQQRAATRLDQAQRVRRHELERGADGA